MSSVPTQSTSLLRPLAPSAWTLEEGDELRALPTAMEILQRCTGNVAGPYELSGLPTSETGPLEERPGKAANVSVMYDVKGERSRAVRAMRAARDKASSALSQAATQGVLHLAEADASEKDLAESLDERLVLTCAYLDSNIAAATDAAAGQAVTLTNGVLGSDTPFTTSYLRAGETELSATPHHTTPHHSS